jgi:tetratricopeptide (TPR) repeat protein
MTIYYLTYKSDIPTATTLCETAISLATSTGNTKRVSQALTASAWIKWKLGNYADAQVHAHEAQRLARMSGNLDREGAALHIEAICHASQGNYKKSISLIHRARNLLNLCGMSGGSKAHQIMISQAEVHKLKSEYVEARNIQTQILREASVDQDSYAHCISLLNYAEIDILVGAPRDNVHRNLNAAKSISTTTGQQRLIRACNCLQADLNLREKDMLSAQALFCTNLKASWGRDSEWVMYCLERLTDVSRWNLPNSPSSWTTVFLAQSLQWQGTLGIHKALQFLGDIFLLQRDEDTAISLFTVALDGFTRMDVHCSRAECMLRLANISQGHGDLLKAVELLEIARQLFERSSQAKQLEHIDEKLAVVGKDILKQYRNNLVRLAEINAPGTVEELEDNFFDIQALEEDGEQEPDPVVG